MTLQIIDQGVLSRQPGHCVIMPSIYQLKDGSLIASQTVGSSLASCDHCVEVLKSEDQGRTWRNLGSIIRPPDQQPWSYRAAYIDELSDERLVMNATRFESTSGDLFDPDSEGLKRPQTVLLWSRDSGETWSSPEVVPVDLSPDRYTWNGSGRMVRFSPKRWMYPFETWKPGGYDGAPDQKAAAIFSTDQGRTWGDQTVIADDQSGQLLWWDQQNTLLSDGRAYVMFWTHRYGTSDDLNVHWVVSDDEGATWTEPKPTNIRGQVCCPIGLPDGRVAAIYNFRQEPQGVHLAVSNDLTHFDLDREVVVFDAKSEATLGKTNHTNFLAEHQLIGFGKPHGMMLNDGNLMVSFWCTVEGVTHTRWVKLRA